MKKLLSAAVVITTMFWGCSPKATDGTVVPATALTEAEKKNINDGITKIDNIFIDAQKTKNLQSFFESKKAEIVKYPLIESVAIDDNGCLVTFKKIPSILYPFKIFDDDEKLKNGRLAAIQKQADLYQNKQRQARIAASTPTNKNIIVINGVSDEFPLIREAHEELYVGFELINLLTFGLSKSKYQSREKNDFTIQNLIKDFTSNGLIIISAHGSFLNQYYISIGQQVSLPEYLSGMITKPYYEKGDYIFLRKGNFSPLCDVLVSENWFAKNIPNNSIPKSIIMLNSCNSARTNGFSKILIDKGASVVLGWTEVERGKNGIDAYTYFFNGLLLGYTIEEIEKEYYDDISKGVKPDFLLSYSNSYGKNVRLNIFGNKQTAFYE